MQSLSTTRLAAPRLLRALSTLPNNAHIKVFKSPPAYILTYLDHPSPLSIGSSTSIPPTPQSFSENPRFTSILEQVLAEHGHADDDVIAQARVLAGPGGAGRGGFVHLIDRRNPPDFGRTAWPEDILGSVEVDGEGNVVGRLQLSGTYRIVTNEGILGLSPFMRDKVIARLKKEEAQGRLD